GKGRSGGLAGGLGLLKFGRAPSPGRRRAPPRLLPPPAGDQSGLRPRRGDHLRPPRLADSAPTSQPRGCLAAPTQAAACELESGHTRVAAITQRVGLLICYVSGASAPLRIHQFKFSTAAWSS